MAAVLFVPAMVVAAPAASAAPGICQTVLDMGPDWKITYCVEPYEDCQVKRIQTSITGYYWDHYCVDAWEDCKVRHKYEYFKRAGNECYVYVPTSILPLP